MTTHLHGLVLHPTYRLRTRHRRLNNYSSTAWTELQTRSGRPIATLAVDLVDKFRRRLAALKRLQKWHKAK